MSTELETLLKGLATDRWMSLRREHNRMFMAYGPGNDWERYKQVHAGEYREIELLQEFTGHKS